MPAKKTGSSAALVRVVQTDAILAPILTAEIVSGLDSKAEKAEKIAALAKQLKITNDDEEAQAAAYMTAIHAQHKAAEDERKAIADPLTQAKKALDARYKKTTEPLELAKAVLARVIGEYRAEKARATALLLAKSTEEAQSPEDRRALVIAGTEEAPRLAGLREVTVYEVVCSEPEKVERAFLVPDVDKAKATIVASEGKVCPAGFTFTKRVEMRATGR